MNESQMRAFVGRLTDLWYQARADADRLPPLSAEYAHGAASAYGLALHALHVFSQGAVEVPADVLGEDGQ